MYCVAELGIHLCYSRRNIYLPLGFKRLMQYMPTCPAIIILKGLKNMANETGQHGNEV